MGVFRNQNFNPGSIVVAIAVIGVVFFWTRKSDMVKTHNQHAQSNRGSTRNPASIQPVFNYSNLEGEALQTAVKQRVVNSMNINKNAASDVEIQMGNFVIRGDQNEKD